MESKIGLYTLIATSVSLGIAIWAGLPAWLDRATKRPALEENLPERRASSTPPTLIKKPPSSSSETITGHHLDPMQEVPGGVQSKTQLSTGPNSQEQEHATGLPVSESLVMEYERTRDRFNAIDQNLRARMRDLNGSNPNPKIIADLATCHLDLAAVKSAIDAADIKGAQTRLDDAKLIINRLSSL